MATLSPSHGIPGETLHLTVTGLRADSGRYPEISFVPSPKIQEVMIVPGSVRQVQAGHYELDITVSASAATRIYEVWIRRDRASHSEVAGAFSVGPRPATGSSPQPPVAAGVG